MIARKRHASKVERNIIKKVGQAIADFDMIDAGDRIMVCVSGGKDSFTMLEVLRALQRRAPVHFELLAVNVNQGWPDYRTDLIAKFLIDHGVEFEMVDADFAAVVEKHQLPERTPCSICSRMRRGLLYNLAIELECSKIALGHHLDDLVETLLLNMFYSGKLASMPAVLRSDDGRNTVIRPLAYAPESQIIEYADEKRFPAAACPCPPDIRGDQKRQVMKKLLGNLEAVEPRIKYQMLAALKNVKPSHLLDRSLQEAWKSAHSREVERRRP